ncbi:MAG: MATE family efflux transporter [Oscillospiraceae bacterium]|nr:MATE family efflux transporter [Oscillospiraceae bacterium]
MRIQLSDHFTYSRLVRFTLPSVAMMIFSSIYGIVDGFFISNFAGKTPFAAVNLIMPVLMILSTVGFMFGTGGAAIVAKTRGEDKAEQANSFFSLFVYTAGGLGVILTALSFVFIRRICALIGASGELGNYCVLYARIILLALPFNIMHLMFQSFFAAAEKPNVGLAVTFSAGVTNMVLDALLVTLLPQDYKLAGAAVATAVSQFAGGFISLVYFLRKNGSALRLGKTSFDGRALGRACVNGSSEFMSNISMNVVGILYNIQLIKYAGENGIAAYGVMMYAGMVFSAAFIGYSVGAAPIVSYSYGAYNKTELKGLLRKSAVIIAVVSVCMVALSELLAVPLSKIFVGYDAELTDLTVSGFRTSALSFAFMGYAIFFSAFFTALNDGLTSAAISFMRTLLFQSAAVLLLPLLLGIQGIWFSIVAAELAAVLLSIIFLIAKRKRYGYH